MGTVRNRKVVHPDGGVSYFMDRWPNGKRYRYVLHLSTYEVSIGIVYVAQRIRTARQYMREAIAELPRRRAHF